jgi:hypothetical protein
MNNLDRFCPYNEIKSDNKIHDKYTTKPNILFDMIIWNSKNIGAISHNSLCKPSPWSQSYVMGNYVNSVHNDTIKYFKKCAIKIFHTYIMHYINTTIIHQHCISEELHNFADSRTPNTKKKIYFMLGWLCIFE